VVVQKQGAIASGEGRAGMGIKWETSERGGESLDCGSTQGSTKPYVWTRYC